MNKKVRLDKVLCNLTGVPFVTDNNQPLTVRKVLLDCLGTYLASSGEEAVRVWKLGMKLIDAEEVSLSDDEAAILKNAVTQNSPRYVAVVVAQVLLELGDES